MSLECIYRYVSVHVYVDHLLSPPEPCPAGEYSPTGYPPCTPCPSGYYQATPGSDTCDECPTGETTDPGADASADCFDNSKSNVKILVDSIYTQLCPYNTLSS